MTGDGTFPAGGCAGPCSAAAAPPETSKHRTEPRRERRAWRGGQAQLSAINNNKRPVCLNTKRTSKSMPSAVARGAQTRFAEQRGAEERLKSSGTLITPSTGLRGVGSCHSFQGLLQPPCHTPQGAGQTTPPHRWGPWRETSAQEHPAHHLP